MKPVAAIGAAIVVVGLLMSSIGFFVAGYGMVSRPGEWGYFTLLGVGVLVGLAGITLTYMAQLVQGGINEYKTSQKAKLPTVREALDKLAVDELSAARLSSMWQQEARKVREIIEEEDWDDDDDS
jgi:hypothetical protein